MNPGQGKNLGQEDFDGSGKKKSEQRRSGIPLLKPAKVRTRPTRLMDALWATKKTEMCFYRRCAH